MKIEFIKVVKKIKKEHGKSCFYGSRLDAFIKDYLPNIDNQLTSVLKKASEIGIGAKINDAIQDDDIAMHVDKIRHLFVKNSGLEEEMAILIFDVYLFGLGVIDNVNPEDYLINKESKVNHITDVVEETEGTSSTAAPATTIANDDWD